MNKKYLIPLIIMLFCTPPLIYAQTETAPQVRYANVEKITVESIDIYGMGEFVDASHFIYTFALFRVDNWAERCYFSAWVDTILVANWSVGFSARDPPGLQGIYLDYDTGILQTHTIMAEFPYTSETKLHPEDGQQKYYYYRMHFYFDTKVFTGAEVRVAADYMKAPTFKGSELLILKLLRSRIVDGIETFDFIVVEDTPTRWNLLVQWLHRLLHRWKLNRYWKHWKPTK